MMQRRLIRITRKLVPIITALGLTMAPLLSSLAPHAAALTSNPTPTAKVSFTFDDGLTSAITQAQPVLTNHGLTGTDYVITGCVGMQPRNTCRANQDASYMTWAQIQSLQNDFGWEIGSHTVDHDCLASSATQDPDDCQRRQLTAAQLDAELSQSKAALAANGINATDFAPPYGDYSNTVLAQIAKYYATMRGFQDQNRNIWPYDDYLLNDVTVQEGVDTVASIEAKIDQSITDKGWLILTFHEISPTPSTNPDDYEFGSSELDQLAAYVAAKQADGVVKSVTVNQGLVNSDVNLLANGTFNDGIADGWTTDDPTNITADAGTNGSYPDATHAIKFVSPANGEAHLFSPRAAVDPYSTYLFKNFLNLQAITTGQVAFYVDEYNAAGDWVSGQYLKQENAAFVENMNFTYKPSSVAVSKASLQVIVGGAGVMAYLDNTQLFPVGTDAPQTNLVANGTFNDGIADGWTTDDPAGITADTASHGSPTDQPNSVALVAGTAGNTHLFSPLVAVSADHHYGLTSFLNVAAINSGEVGLYMDEYDADGNWISGQYITGVHSVTAGNAGFTYIPSSATVAKASLQVIVVHDSGINAYFDDVKWYQN